MRRILITGKDSYIGTSFEKYINGGFSDSYTVDTLDMIGDGWRGADLSGYDTVFHVAGIAHSDSGKISPERAALYYAVNTDLAAETAERARAAGVKQFIYMSSAIVYGASAPIGKDKEITADTEPAPENSYGDSKLQAERRLLPMDSDSFKVVILRPPMIYGKGSKGNYPTLAKMARKLPVFPRVENRRSMLYIDNLCEFVRLMIENGERGVFFPQNSEYTNTSELVRLIAATHGKRVRLLGGFTPLLRLLGHLTPLVNKAFGSLAYAAELSAYKQPYALYSLERSIEETEK